MCGAFWYNNFRGVIRRRFVDSEVRPMKENIHPNYTKSVVRCVCGETFETGSTKKEMRVDICSKCHPFFTGKQKMVDSGGRVDRFKKRYGI
jgi:large subunit ribosomal protein L31